MNKTFSSLSHPTPPQTQALTDQAIAATGSEAAAVLPPPSQRRLARILRELDPNALQKLLLWESVLKEEAEGVDSRRLNRLRMRVQATVKALDKQAVRESVCGGGGACVW